MDHQVYSWPCKIYCHFLLQISSSRILQAREQSDRSGGKGRLKSYLILTSIYAESANIARGIIFQLTSHRTKSPPEEKVKNTIHVVSTIPIPPLPRPQGP